DVVDLRQQSQAALDTVDDHASGGAGGSRERHEHLELPRLWPIGQTVDEAQIDEVEIGLGIVNLEEGLARRLLDGAGLIERGHGRLAMTTPRLPTNNSDEATKAIAPATLSAAASTTTPTMSAISPACMSANCTCLGRSPRSSAADGTRLSPTYGANRCSHT